MKVFVTGGSGFVGSAVVSELSEIGHQVVGLARSEEATKKMKSLGTNVEVISGDLESLDILKKGAREAEGIIHLGFIHDFNNYEQCCAIDRAATIAMLEAITGSNKPFIYTSGALSLPDGQISDETVVADESMSIPRGMTENIALSFKERDVRVSSVRLPLTVHRKGDKAFIPWIIDAAKKYGKSGYVGDGQNVWSAVARLDAAHLFRLVLEKGRAGGIYHGISEQGIKTKDIATTIGETLKIPVVSIPNGDSSQHFGFSGFFFSKNV